MSIFDSVRRHARATPEQPAVVWQGGSLSYAQLHHRALRLAAHLQAAGLGEGCRVALFLPNVSEFVVAYHAAQAMGAVPVSLNALLRPDELLRLLADCQPQALIAHADLLGQLPELRAATHLRLVFVVGEGPIPPGAAALPDLDTGRLAEPALPDPDALAAVLYTSGTTGEPRGVMLSQANVTSNVAAVAAAMDLRKGDVMLCFLPLFHCFGQNHIAGAAAHAGATVRLMRRYDEAQILELARVGAFSCFFAVPTVYRRLLANPAVTEAFAGVRYCFSAAAPMDAALATAWLERFGRPIWEGYGLTETSPFACYNHPTAYVPGAVGLPIDGVRMAVLDPDGRPLGPGEVGEVAVAGPCVMMGYLGRPELTAEALRGGWFHTGDLGYRDEAGVYFLVDRIKDVINCAGFKVWPREVEGALSGAPGVLQVAVVGLPDPDHGEAVCAVVVPQGDGPLDELALEAFARARLAPYKVPRLWVRADALPISPSGKILRRRIQEKLASCVARGHPGALLL